MMMLVAFSSNTFYLLSFFSFPRIFFSWIFFNATTNLSIHWYSFLLVSNYIIMNRMFGVTGAFIKYLEFFCVYVYVCVLFDVHCSLVSFCINIHIYLILSTSWIFPVSIFWDGSYQFSKPEHIWKCRKILTRLSPNFRWDLCAFDTSIPFCHRHQLHTRILPKIYRLHFIVGKWNE